MAHETVPADIAAAIEDFRVATWCAGYGQGELEERAEARAALDAVILKHLRNADEMKAALERIEQAV